MSVVRKYALRAPVVEAMQYLGDNAALGEFVPVSEVPEGFWLSTGPAIARGQWIVKDRGRISIMTDEEFRFTYEPMVWETLPQWPRPDSSIESWMPLPDWGAFWRGLLAVIVAVGIAAVATLIILQAR